MLPTKKYNILICGSEGSLMQAVIPYLLKKYNLIGIDNFFRYGVIRRKRDYKFIKGDLCNEKFVEVLFKKNKIDFILQAAARIFGVRGFHKVPADILTFDIKLHQNILQNATDYRIKRVVYVSSSMVYERSTKLPNCEQDIENIYIPLTDYGLSKIVGERLCRAYYKQYKLPYTIWRPFNIITPFERVGNETGISHVFADFIEKILIKKQNPLIILGSGKQVRSFTWIYEIAQAIGTYSFSPKTKNKIFNLGQYNNKNATEATTMTELAKKIFQKGKEYHIIARNKKLKIKHIQDPLIKNTDVQYRIPSSQFAHQTFGWQTKIDLNKALDFCIQQILKEKIVRLLD